MTTLPAIIYNQLFVSLPEPKFDLAGQTAIVTGSNTGLGFEAARHLVRLNAETVILAVRNIEKGEHAKQRIEESTKKEGVVEVWELDLSSYESVKSFVRKCNQNLQRLDCVIGNAAIGPGLYKTFEDNEAALTVNIVSTFLLNTLLLPLCRKTSRLFNVQPRLTFIVSEVHGMARLPERQQPDIFAALNADKSSSGMRRRYGVTKLLGVLLTKELAARMGKPDNQGVIVNCANPGFCVSDLGRDAPAVYRPLMVLLNLILARTTEMGSRAHVFAAAGSAETHGQYMSNGRVEPPSEFVRSKDGMETQHRVYDELLKKLEKINPGISQLVVGK
ncbi:short-chain dehydrogenase/reductase-like protein [Rhizodiscina lignyota]|uniref:Short-chain dehydrogenase/reductase-like protein n=1 Tax=Rhizodiscina lignyota TaxID=1504668 RepID=A0A9P4I6H7_9PEZI|nr:short-chain dehydrogenase/reductase-like protein [Rhizodiscina lignyota]